MDRGAWGHKESDTTEVTEHACREVWGPKVAAPAPFWSSHTGQTLSWAQSAVSHTGKLQFHTLLSFFNECVCLVTSSCLTHCNPTICSPPGSSVQGIIQERILEWVAISYSRVGVILLLPDPRVGPESPGSSALAGRLFTTAPPGKPSLRGIRLLILKGRVE